MAISLTNISVARSRRVRLFFSTPLAAGAFNPNLYTVTATDSNGTSPGINAVYAVGSNTAACELVLDTELLDGAGYLVTAVGVPATDTTVTPAGTQDVIRYGAITPLANAEPNVSDGELILYGRDVVWGGSDFQETAEGDLAIVAGEQNAVAALLRRFTGSPLPYDPTYSPNAREFVDGNDARPLKNRIRQQAFLDSRVASISVELSLDTDGNPIFLVSPKLIGGHAPQPITVQ